MSVILACIHEEGEERWQAGRVTKEKKIERGEERERGGERRERRYEEL